MAKRHAHLGGSAVEFNLSMSRYDIASYLGLVVETVSRMIRRFQEEGSIEVNRRWIHIINKKMLKQRLISVAERKRNTSKKQALSAD